eukprot:6204696-Pleurochrysis_carterae.AAC.3
MSRPPFLARTHVLTEREKLYAERALASFNQSTSKIVSTELACRGLSRHSRPVRACGAQVPAFMECADEFVSQLSCKMRPSVYLPGSTIFHAGTTGKQERAREAMRFCRGHLRSQRERGLENCRGRKQLAATSLSRIGSVTAMGSFIAPGALPNLLPECPLVDRVVGTDLEPVQRMKLTTLFCAYAKDFANVLALEF